MTNAFKQLLYIYGDAICARKTHLPENADRDEIAKKAIEQNVLPIVYFNLFGEDTQNRYYPVVMQALAANERKMFFLNKLLREMEESGFFCCVLKGCTLASLYASPDLRVSGDVDLLINPKDEKKVIEFLEKRNFIIHERYKGGHHFEARHNKAGLFEVHVSVYEKDFSKSVLKDKFKAEEPFESMITSSGIAVNVLGKNDGLYFVTAHMIKHFVKDGLGLRQISDWILYIKNYRDVLNMEEYDEVIKELGFDKFINAMYTVGKKYWGIELGENFEEDPSDILTDMEEGGSFGHNDSERSNYKQQLVNEVYGRKEPQKKKNIFIRFLRILFPSRRVLMKKGYIRREQNVLLIPLCWVKMWVDFVKKGKVKNIDKITATNEIDTQKFYKRYTMLRKYHFIKEDK